MILLYPKFYHSVIYVASQLVYQTETVGTQKKKFLECCFLVFL